MSKELQKLICAGCGREFLGKSWRRYCKAQCYRDHPETVERHCVACGALVPKGRMNRNYCSRDCWRSTLVRAFSGEKKRAYHREWKRRQYAKSKDAILENNRRYFQSERGIAQKEKVRRARWENPQLRLKHIVKAAFVRAIRKDIPFDQCIEELIVESSPMYCACCGVAFNYKEEPSRTRKRNSPSIDRVDNDKGYVVGNVQIICWGCNEDKSHLTAEKLKMFLAYIERCAGEMPVGVKLGAEM